MSYGQAKCGGRSKPDVVLINRDATGMKRRANLLIQENIGEVFGDIRVSSDSKRHKTERSRALWITQLAILLN